MEKEKKLVEWGYAKKGVYLQNLFVKHRMNNVDFNNQWGSQAGKCISCGEALAHPFDKQLKQGVRVEVTKRGNLCCVSCNRKGVGE